VLEHHHRLVRQLDRLLVCHLLHERTLELRVEGEGGSAEAALNVKTPSRVRLLARHLLLSSTRDGISVGWGLRWDTVAISCTRGGLVFETFVSLDSRLESNQEEEKHSRKVHGTRSACFGVGGV